MRTKLVEDVREAPAVNRIRGDCVGSTLTLYANGQKLVEASDAELDSGNVGLYVKNLAMQPPATDVLFDNFSVSSL